MKNASTLSQGNTHTQGRVRGTSRIGVVGKLYMNFQIRSDWPRTSVVKRGGSFAPIKKKIYQNFFCSETCSTTRNDVVCTPGAGGRPSTSPNMNIKADLIEVLVTLVLSPIVYIFLTRAPVTASVVFSSLVVSG